ncbi:Choline-sulfatase [Maioricimonas rarisocia]|uniref:Choline-sulfatase n=1 Tax=Maioricimonas rarisocia TaxID=2528026 RepID=A0A517ZBT4_9PLAN|nr:sulfatase [Maioricimonas rarisocia]QDU39954.1 Choline-sulfatase [Maioricimonas rarisocia]
MRALLLLLVPLVAVWTVPADAADRPNVLFIAVDDLNDWIHCLGGHPDCRSPNIDRLAERGTLFTRSYCAAPACNPSRASLMTGVRPWTSGVYVNPQPWKPAMPDAVTLPQHFRNHGYTAVGSGKIFHGAYDDPTSWDDYLTKGRDPKPVPEVLEDPRSRSGGIVWGVLDVEDDAMNDHKMVDYAIDYLSQEHDKPFFLACGIYRPHMPWQVPRKYYDMYPADKVRLPDVPEGDLEDLPEAGVNMARPQGDHAKMLQTGNWRYAVQAYLASITFADSEVGRLLDALDASPHRDNTIIVLWGDHGWHLGEKQHWRKFALWEEATRAPLIMVAPGVTQVGSVCGRTVDFMNIYPTLCELCDLPVTDQLEGVSMLPLLKDPEADWDRAAVTTHGRGNHAVRTERFRYIRYAGGGEELYDHDADPMEWTNLAADENFAAVKRDLARWLPSTEAPEAAYDPKKRPKKARQTTRTRD